MSAPTSTPVHAQTVKVTVAVAGELTIELDALPQAALEQIKSALTIANEEKAKAATYRVHGWWDMPDAITLYRTETRRGGHTVLCLPRGFSMALASGLASLGIAVQWDDQRSLAPAAPGYFKPFVMRDYQLDAALALMRAQQGFYKAPAGSGKTVTVLGMAAWLGQRTLIVVDKANLAQQWRSRAAQFYDMPMLRDDAGKLSAALDSGRTPGLIGEDVWQERDLTVALRQTLHSRKWSVDATRWWSSWGLTVFDEGHHLAAETTEGIARSVTSFYLAGVSATLPDSAMKRAQVHATVGPIVAETPRQILYERGVLMQPEVVVQQGELEAVFWNDHDAEYNTETGRWDCEMPGCKKGNARHSHRNNYQSVLKKLVEDKTRNARIAEWITSRRGRVHLLYTRQKKHIDLLHKAVVAAGWPEEKIWMLRGEENAEGLSQQIADEIEKSDEAVLLSTVADEGLDIPPIDHVHLVFPLRGELGVVQVSGRGERIWPGKEDTFIVDWCEPNVTVFNDQFLARWSVYGRQGYAIKQEEVAA